MENIWPGRPRRYLVAALACLFAPAGLWAGEAREPDSRPRVEARGILGPSWGFGAPLFWALGGSVRFYLSERFAVEPEFFHLRDTMQFGDERYTGFVPNFFYHLGSPEKRIQPYVIGGMGFAHKVERIGKRYTTTGLIANGGFGVKVFLSKRVFISPESRLGFGAFPRITGSIGFVLRRQSP